MNRRLRTAFLMPVAGVALGSLAACSQDAASPAPTAPVSQTSVATTTPIPSPATTDTTPSQDPTPSEGATPSTTPSTPVKADLLPASVGSYQRGTVTNEGDFQFAPYTGSGKELRLGVNKTGQYTAEQVLFDIVGPSDVTKRTSGVSCATSAENKTKAACVVTSNGKTYQVQGTNTSEDALETFLTDATTT